MMMPGPAQRTVCGRGDTTPRRRATARPRTTPRRRAAAWPWRTLREREQNQSPKTGGKLGSAPLEEGADARPGRHGHDDLHKRDAAERRWGTPACGGHRNQYRPARTGLVRLVAQGSKPGMRGQGPQPRIDHSRIIRVGGDAAPDHLEPTQDQRSEQGGCNSTKAHTTRANACRCSPADNMHRLSRPGSGDTARRSNRCDTVAD